MRGVPRCLLYTSVSSVFETLKSTLSSIFNGIKSTVVSVWNGIKSAIVTPDVYKRQVRESWNSVYRGVNNAHKIAVLEEGMKYQQIGIPPEEDVYKRQGHT